MDEYLNKLADFLQENYNPRVIRDLAKHFDYFDDSGDESDEKKAENIRGLLDSVVSNNQLYAFFCVLKQFKKYHKKGIDELIAEGVNLVAIPAQMIRPKLEKDRVSGKSVEKDDAENAPDQQTAEQKNQNPQETEPSEARSVDLQQLLENRDGIFKNGLKAIIIGVGKDLFNRDNGSCCVKDAEAVRDFLKEQYGLPDDRITFLSGYVSGKEAMAKLKEFCANSRYADNVLFYFSGYGMEQSGNSYLMTSDSYVHGTTIRNALRVISVHEMIRECKARVKLFVFDANNCGQRLDELPASGTVEVEAVKDVEWNYESRLTDKMWKDVFSEGTAMMTFAACDSSEKAYESDALQHGCFTYWLLEGLKNKSARRKNQSIYMEDLKIYTTRQVIKYVSENGAAQTPQYQCEMNGNIYME